MQYREKHGEGCGMSIERVTNKTKIDKNEDEQYVPNTTIIHKKSILTR